MSEESREQKMKLLLKFKEEESKKDLDKTPLKSWCEDIESELKINRIDSKSQKVKTRKMES